MTRQLVPPGYGQGISGLRRIKFRFCQNEAFQRALENVNTERRDAVTSFAEFPGGYLCEQTEFISCKVHAGDESLLRSTCWRRPPPGSAPKSACFLVPRNPRPAWPLCGGLAGAFRRFVIPGDGSGPDGKTCTCAGR